MRSVEKLCPQAEQKLPSRVCPQFFTYTGLAIAIDLTCDEK